MCKAVTGCHDHIEVEALPPHGTVSTSVPVFRILTYQWFGPLRLPSNKMSSSEHRALGQERIEQLWQPSKQVFHDNQVLSFA